MSERQILIVDCGSKADSIQRIVTEFGFKPVRVRLDDILRMNHVEWSGILVSGSPILLTEIDYDQYLQSLSFVLTSACPVLGVCFGHQVIGLLHGAAVFRGVECRSDQRVKILERNTLFEGLENVLAVKEDHCEGITLPHRFMLLATSENYSVEAMKHYDKELYGVQFHPEVSGKVGQRIIENFLRLCK